jgi:hypothetical protein
MVRIGRLPATLFAGILLLFLFWRSYQATTWPQRASIEGLAATAGQLATATTARPQLGAGEPASSFGVTILHNIGYEG